jgi:hypothetical protein
MDSFEAVEDKGLKQLSIVLLAIFAFWEDRQLVPIELKYYPLRLLFFMAFIFKVTPFQRSFST